MSDPCGCECCDHMPDTTAFLQSFTDGTFTIRPPEWFAPLMIGCFKQTLDDTDAPNYLEMRVGDKEGSVYPLILCRPGRPSPHELREAAEAERDQFKALWDGTRETAERLRTALEYIARGHTNGNGNYARHALAQIDARGREIDE